MSKWELKNKEIHKKFLKQRNTLGKKIGFAIFVFNIVEKYETAGKQIHLKHLSEECKELLYKSNSKFKEVIVEDIDDPRYHLAANPESFTKGLFEK